MLNGQGYLRAQGTEQVGFIRSEYSNLITVSTNCSYFPLVAVDRNHNERTECNRHGLALETRVTSDIGDSCNLARSNHLARNALSEKHVQPDCGRFAITCHGTWYENFSLIIQQMQYDTLGIGNHFPRSVNDQLENCVN